MVRSDLLNSSVVFSAGLRVSRCYKDALVLKTEAVTQDVRNAACFALDFVLGDDRQTWARKLNFDGWLSLVISKHKHACNCTLFGRWFLYKTN